MSTTGISTLPFPARTAQYIAINNAEKDLALAMADMSILETLPETHIQSLATEIFETGYRPKIFIADANWPPAHLQTLLTSARHSSTVTIFEPVSTAKALRIFPPKEAPSVFPTPLADIITPNNHELIALHDFALNSSYFELPEWFTIIDALGIPSSGLRVPLAITTTPDLVDQGIPQQAIKLLPFFPTILIKLGPRGVLMVKLLSSHASELEEEEERQYVLARGMGEVGKNGVGGLYIRLFPVEKVLKEEVVSVNGVGDTFLGALASRLSKGERVQDGVPFAQRAAGLTLRSREMWGWCVLYIYIGVENGI
jgi:pseudouridine-5'-phosphate glycosidase/pseudouridine kinase